MNLFESIYDNAKNLATYKHGKTGATRRFTGLPYIVHPEGVERILQSLTSDEDLLAAAWAHDLLEDTDTNFDELMRTLESTFYTTNFIRSILTHKCSLKAFNKFQMFQEIFLNIHRHKSTC
jgi:(p)ppGpp synthase/HD superfamily hydrolase